MEFVSQKSAMEALKSLAEDNKQSILLEGICGCGKSHLAKIYSTLVGAEDFQTVVPKVSELKECIDNCMQIQNKVVVCIENLDTGVAAASYAILKFLEEPLPHVYIVVTCRNLQRVPDTIISRCSTISVSPPINTDIELYAMNVHAEKFKSLINNPLLKCVRTFTDVDIVLNLNANQLEYFKSLHQLCDFRDTVSNIVWKLGHYEDNTETPIELVIRYIMEICNTRHIQIAGVECITDLLQKTMGTHAVLAKFVFECKYCE